MLFTCILVLLFLVSLGLSISSICYEKMKNLSTKLSDESDESMKDFYKTFIFTNYKDFLNKNLGVSNINDLGLEFCDTEVSKYCKEKFTKYCTNSIIYNTKTANLLYCFEDKNNIVYNYYTSQKNYNIAKTKLNESISAAKSPPAAIDNFRKQDKNN